MTKFEELTQTINATRNPLFGEMTEAEQKTVEVIMSKTKEYWTDAEQGDLRCACAIIKLMDVAPTLTAKEFAKISGCEMKIAKAMKSWFKKNLNKHLVDSSDLREMEKAHNG